jgi:hypothetical protein
VIRRILLDLDDTLNSLTLHILGAVRGLNVGPYDYDRFPVEVGYGIIEAYEKLKLREPNPQDFETFNVQTFWDAVPRAAWSNTPQSPQFDYLIETSEAEVGRENVCIITSPTKDPECLAGKLEWIHSNLPKWLHRQYLVGPRKHFCARPDTLLIDDSDDNCNLFRQHGGHALLVPRPWNTNHFYDTNAYLRACFDHIFVMRNAA